MWGSGYKYYKINMNFFSVTYISIAGKCDSYFMEGLVKAG